MNLALLNYAKWIREVCVVERLSSAYVTKLDVQNVVDICAQDASRTVEDCFGTNNDSRYQLADLSQDWRLWVFQFCSQWGYFTVRLAFILILLA